MILPILDEHDTLIHYMFMRGIILIICMSFVAGCAASTANVQREALKCGFIELRLPTQMFTLYALLRSGALPDGKVLRVYIEGDGHAWESLTRPSSDPTPRNPVGLRLAVADSGRDAVLYLARPCQYVQNGDSAQCSNRYWTSARLGPEVIGSLDAAITQAKAACGAEQVMLVGFSGGGGAAALLAAARQDVVFLGTVAGNLDSDAWASLQGVSPLAESLNPVAVAPSLRHLPQRHLSSRTDTVMPPQISAGFCREASQPESCVVISGVAHGGPWQEYWNYEYTVGRK